MFVGGPTKSIFTRNLDHIDEWFSRRPHIHPPHIRKLLNPGNRNYVVQKNSFDDEVEVVDENVKDNFVNVADMWGSNIPSSKKLVSMLGSSKGMSPSIGQGSASEHQHGGTLRAGGGLAILPRISPFFFHHQSHGAQWAPTT